MSIYVSPGVYSREVDLSDIIPNLSSTSAALVGYSRKGDTANARLLTNTKQFIDEYGEPEVGNYFHYMGLAYLEKGRQLWALRVVNGALYGGVKIMEAGSSDSNASLTTGEASPDFVAVSGEDILFYVYGRDPGVWNADTSIKITGIDAATYEFVIEVYSNSILVESFTVSRRQQKDGYGVQQYLETAINGRSKYIRVADNTTTADTILPKDQPTALALGGGIDGNDVTSSNVITGWDVFSNPDEIDVRMLINGGYTDVQVQSKIKTVAEDRKDCIAVLDMPFSELTSVSSMVTWRNTTQNFDSSYCALYSPWCKVYDQFNDQEVIVPPSGYVAAQYAYNDFVSEPWDAPAGNRRGQLNVLGLTNIFTPASITNPSGERDVLYAAQINPLQTFSGRGNVIWGQKTQQKRASALDRINVRRLLIVLEKAIAAFLANFVFERNNSTTRFRIKAQIDLYLRTLSAQGAFYTEAGDSGYTVICDTSNNPAEVIDRNELHVDVYIKPTRSAEFIQLQTIVTTSGASFNELISQNTII